MTAARRKKKKPLYGSDREALTLLKGITERAANVTFSMKDGLLRMSVFIGYFDEVY